MLRVLLIEDNRFDAMLVTSKLGGVAEVSHAPSMAAAIHYAADKLFDVAILDLELGDGTDNAVQAFVQRSRRPMPILVYSGNEINQEDAAWVDGVVPKPASKEDLVRAIRRIVVKVDEEYTAQTVQRLRSVVGGLQRLAAM
jgi:CheY-like chemotaxis protein